MLFAFDSMTITGIFKHRDREYKFEVILKDIEEGDILHILTGTITNPEGMHRRFNWRYKTESLYEELLDVIYITSPMLDNRKQYKKPK